MPKIREEISSRSVQDYLRALALHSSSNDDTVSTNEISRYFEIAPASVTEMLQKLAENGLVNYSPYHGTTLTPKGLREAQKITRKHRLLERFLYDVLHIRKDRVHSQACDMEHALSDEAEESMCRLLKHPDRCPDDGQIIPACNLSFSSCEQCMEANKQGSLLQEIGKRRENLISIGDLKPGATGKVSFIRGEHRILQRLLDMGLTAGTSIKVERVAPLNGPLEVSVRGSNIAIGQDIAANVFVEAPEKK